MMKIVELANLTKPITFRGQVIVVPNHTEWMAINPGGLLVAYSEEPRIIQDKWIATAAQYTAIARVNYFGDWKETLEQVAL